MSNSSIKPRDIEILRDFSTWQEGGTAYSKGQRIDNSRNMTLIALAQRGELARFTDELPAVQPAVQPARSPQRTDPPPLAPAGNTDDQPAASK